MNDKTIIEYKISWRWPLILLGNVLMNVGAFAYWIGRELDNFRYKEIMDLAKAELEEEPKEEVKA